VVTRLELKCLKLNLYSPQMSYKNGGDGLLTPIDTMFYVTAAIVLTSGLRQNQVPVRLAEVKI
jgi:hypothetical protein